MTLEEQNEYGEDFEIWLENPSGSSPVSEVCALNSGGVGCDIILGRYYE